MSHWVSTGAASLAAIVGFGEEDGAVFDVKLRSIALPGVLVLGGASTLPTDTES